MKTTLELNHAYLVREDKNSDYSSICKKTVIAVTETCYQFKRADGSETWVLKTDVEKHWEIIEDLGAPVVPAGDKEAFRKQAMEEDIERQKKFKDFIEELKKKEKKFFDPPINPFRPPYRPWRIEPEPIRPWPPRNPYLDWEPFWRISG